MNAQVQESTAVAVIPPKPLTVIERAAAVFNAIPSEDSLKELVKNSATITTITNPAGYDQCHAARMVLKNVRLEIARTGEAGREDAVQTSKAIISIQKQRIAITQIEEERLQAIQDAWDAAIEAEKEAKILAEIKRVQDIQDRITELRGAPAACASSSSALINEHIGDIERIIVDDSFAEFRAEAEQAKTVTLASLNGLFAAAMDREAAAEKLKRDLADLERLRAENAERERVAEEDRKRKAKEENDRLVAEARAHADQIRKDNEAQEANRLHNEAVMGELQSIHHQLIIADMGRAPYVKGGTVDGHDYLIAETEAWEITEEKFGALYNAAVQTKARTVESLKQKRVDLVARLAQDEANRVERQRLTDEQAEIDRKNEVERQRQAEETARVVEARRQLEADQAAHAEAQRKASEPPPPLPSVNKPRVRMMAEFDSEEVIQILMRHYSAQRNEIVYHLSTTRWAEAAA